MKILKSILFVVIAIVLLALVAGIMIPKEYTVSVSQVIKKPKQEVFDYVKLLKNQEQYSVWVMADKGMSMVYTGTDGAIGASSAWNSKDDNVGEGSQTITKIEEGVRIDVDLKFERPMKDEAKAATIFKSMNDTETEVVSEFYGKAPFPLNILSFIGKKFIKDAETENLQNLKNILEK